AKLGCAGKRPPIAAGHGGPGEPRAPGAHRRRARRCRSRWQPTSYTRSCQYRETNDQRDLPSSSDGSCLPADNLAQNAVDEAGRVDVAVALGDFNGLVHRHARGNVVEMEDFVESDAQHIAVDGSQAVDGP